MCNASGWVRVVIAVAWLVGCGGGSLNPLAIEHNAHGARHLEAGRLDEAEARFRLALEYHPKFSEAHANLGLISLRREDLRGAEEHLRAAIELNEDFAVAWANLGVVLDRQNRSNEAAAAFVEALAIDPGLAFARRNLASLHLRQRELGEARAQLMRLVELEPSDVEAQCALAFVELELRRPHAAIERASSLIQREPTTSRAFLIRGLARLSLHSFEDAASDFTVARSAEATWEPATKALAIACALGGNVAEAQRLLGELRARHVEEPTLAGLQRVLGGGESETD